MNRTSNGLNLSAQPKIGELWVTRKKDHPLEFVVQIDYVDEDVVWYTFIDSDEDDWCGIEFFCYRSRKFNE